MRCISLAVRSPRIDWSLHRHDVSTDNSHDEWNKAGRWIYVVRGWEIPEGKCRVCGLFLLEGNHSTPPGYLGRVTTDQVTAHFQVVRPVTR